MKNFKWTDEKVKEFCRVYTIGGYTDDYKDCNTIEKKMNKFKLLKKKIMKNNETILDKIELFRKLVSEIDISKYEQEEFGKIVYQISIEVFSRQDIEILRTIKIV